MMHVTLRLAAVSLMALLLAACSGTKTDVTGTPTGGAAATTAAGTAQATTTTPAGLAASSKLCSDWAATAAQQAEVSGQPTGSSADTKADFDAMAAYMKALADQAPAEIKGDFQVYAKFWSDYAAVMAKANYDVTRMATDPEMQKAMQAMSDPKLQQATVNIQNWMQKNCVAGR